MWRNLFFFAFAIFLLTPGMGVAQTIDPHAIFEERCSRCHTPHAGEFARKALAIQPGGQITGRKTKQPLESFLSDHSGNPSHPEIAALMDMFAIQLRSGGVFEKKCRICHSSAKKLARIRLELRNGKLVDLFTARDIREFLKDHGRLTVPEIEVMSQLFIWQLQTADR